MKKIIIVDDDPVSNYLTRKTIECSKEKKNIEVYCKTFEALRNLKKSNQKNTLLILDLNMPDINGYQLLDILSERSLFIKTIILTSSCNLVEENYARKYKNVCGYYRKPLTSENIKEIEHL
jgi:CheY-like chemotaxis protein